MGAGDATHPPASGRSWSARTSRGVLAAGGPPASSDRVFRRRGGAPGCAPSRDPIPPIPREVVAETARVYIDAFERITGDSFSVLQSETPVLQRIRANLSRYL